MKRKTIEKVTSRKMEAWLESITDKKLREDVRRNLLVSGGSIASMFLKMPVNDYDIYIKDMDVLIRLANYYCTCRVLDGRKRQEYLEKDFPKVVENDGMYVNGDTEEEYVAESYVRIDNLNPDQVKLDIGGAGIRFDDLKEDVPYQVAFVSQNAISLTDDIQIVLRFHGTVEEIHKTFDFIHATNYFTFDEGLVTNLPAMESLITKNLQYQGSLYPLTSIIRIKKFLARGWTVSAGEMLKIMFQISELNLRDIRVLEEQLIGVDVAYFSTLINILRGVNRKDMTSQYLNTLIDRVFNEYDEDGDHIKPADGSEDELNFES